MRQIRASGLRSSDVKTEAIILSMMILGAAVISEKICAADAATKPVSRPVVVSPGTNLNRFSLPPPDLGRPTSTFPNPVQPTIPVQGGTFVRPDSTFSSQSGTFSRPSTTFSNPLEPRIPVQGSTFSRPTSTFPNPVPPTIPVPGGTFHREPTAPVPSRPPIAIDLPPGARILTNRVPTTTSR